MLVSYMNYTALFYHLEQLMMKYVHLIDEIETMTTFSCQLILYEIMNDGTFIKKS